MVEALGNQLLARTALSDHKDGTIERRSAARPLDRVEESEALADKLIGPLHADCWWQIPRFGKIFRS
jgi:hypothetical protein